MVIQAVRRASERGLSGFVASSMVVSDFFTPRFDNILFCFHKCMIRVDFCAEENFRWLIRNDCFYFFVFQNRRPSFRRDMCLAIQVGKVTDACSG